VTYQERSFEPVPSSVGMARTFVTEALHVVGDLDSISDWARLVTSELATNAVIHARTEFDVGVDTNGEVVISVSDHEATAPVLVERGLESSGGRGISIVARSSGAWGVEPRGIGKRVWCSTTTARPPNQEVHPWA
jgi:hypothetical protein